MAAMRSIIICIIMCIMSMPSCMAFILRSIACMCSAWLGGAARGVVCAQAPEQAVARTNRLSNRDRGLMTGS